MQSISERWLLGLVLAGALLFVVQSYRAVDALEIAQPQKMPSFAAFGQNVYVVWYDNLSENGGFLFSKSVDGGISFTNPKKILDGVSVNMPISLGASGKNVFLVWSDPNSPYDIFFMRSNDAGDTFEAAMNLSNDFAFSNFPQLAISGNNVYVIWLSSDDTFGNDILLRSSLDNGKSFGSITTLTAFGSHQLKLTALEDSVYAAWVELSNEQHDIVFAASSDNGKKFNKLTIGDPNMHDYGPDIFPTKNAVYLTYYEWTGEEADYRTASKVILQKSTDSGKTFDQTLQVSGNDSGLFSEVPQIIASSSSAETGDNVCLVWRDAASNKTEGSLRISNDNAETFGEIVTLSNITSAYPTAAISVAEGKDVLLVAWGNSIEYGKWDIFLASIDEEGDVLNISKVSDSGHTSDPRLVATSNSSAYLFWTDRKYDQEHDDIFFRSINSIDKDKDLEIGPIVRISAQRADNTEVQSGDGRFEIWASDTVMSTAWHSFIQGTICPSPVTDPGREVQYDPETQELTDLGSDVEITYYAISPDGSQTAIEQGVFSSTIDYCSQAPGSFLDPDMEGTWTIFAIARWVSEGSINEIQSNHVNVIVNPPIYASTLSEVLKVNATNYPLLKLLDWSSDGKSILVAYDNTYNASLGIDPDITPSIEIGVLGIMNPEGTEIRSIDLPLRFKSFTDARFSPSRDEMLLITGSTYENQATIYRYDLRTNKVEPLADIAGYAVWVPDMDGDGIDDIVFGKEVRGGPDQADLKSFEIWLAGSNGTLIEKLYQQLVDDEAGFRTDDSSSDGNSILITVNKKSDHPIGVNDIKIFDLQTRKLDTILSSINTGSARFAPFSGLVLYSIGPGYKSPAGPLNVMTNDGSYHEQLQVGERPGTGDSPGSYVVSPDGRLVVAAIQSFGGGELYITSTQLRQAIPEFGSGLAIIISGGAVVGITLMRRYKAK